MVTESDSNSVSIFSSSEEKLRPFGTRGYGQGQFNKPCGVAVDGEGNILVADSNNNRIQKFTAEGHQLVLKVMDVYSLIVLVASHLMGPMLRCMLRSFTITEYKF